jgi:hypothetical protein
VKVTAAVETTLKPKLLRLTKRVFFREPDAPRPEIRRTGFVPSLAGGIVGRMTMATACASLLLLGGCATTGASLDKLDPQRAVQRLVHQQVHQEHAGTFEVGGEEFGAGIKLGLEPLADDHPLVAETPSRAARTDGTTWVRTFWMFEPSVGASTSIPVGSATVTAGLNANAKIEAEMIAPYQLGSLRAPNLPVSLDAPMVPGQEAIFGARGLSRPMQAAASVPSSPACWAIASRWERAQADRSTWGESHGSTSASWSCLAICGWWR